MRTILALSLIAATFAFATPAGATTCDPVLNAACAGSYAYGTCSNGYQSNVVYLFRNDANGYLYVSGGTYCYAYPGFGSGNGLGAGATYCEPGFANCASAGASWSASQGFGGSSCGSWAYVYAQGAYNGRELPLCSTAGNPPVIPSLGLP